MQKTVGVRLLIAFLIAEIVLLSSMVFVEVLYAVYPYPIRATIEAAATETGVPSHVILSTIKVESNFKTDAVSPKGAIGLMQIMPATFAWVTNGSEEYDIYNAADNILVGARYLAYLYEKYQNWDAVHAAYNAGDGAVDRWLTNDRYSKDGVLTDIPYPETATYLRRVKFAKKIYTHLYFR